MNGVTILNSYEYLTNKEFRNLDVTTKQMMLGKTPSIQYIWRTNNAILLLNLRFGIGGMEKMLATLKLGKSIEDLGCLINF